MSQKPVVRRRKADEDIEAAFAFYLSEAGTEIAADFIDRFEEAIKRIARHPAIGSPRYGHELHLAGLRHWPIKKFPYWSSIWKKTITLSWHESYTAAWTFGPGLATLSSMIESKR